MCKNYDNAGAGRTGLLIGSLLGGIGGGTYGAFSGPNKSLTSGWDNKRILNTLKGLGAGAVGGGVIGGSYGLAREVSSRNKADKDTQFADLLKKHPEIATHPTEEKLQSAADMQRVKSQEAYVRTLLSQKNLTQEEIKARGTDSWLDTLINVIVGS